MELPMFSKFLLIPLTMWLLLPPGICVCRGFGNLLPILATESLPSDDLPLCEDSEHAPWCPIHKMTYLSDSNSAIDSDLASAWIETLSAIVAPILPHERGDAFPARAAYSADPPLYLNLCALRI